MGLVVACQLAVPVFAQTGTTQSSSETTQTQQTESTSDTTQTEGTTGGTTSTTETDANKTAENTATALPAINSDSYIVMNAETGQVLISKNPDKKQYPASITKILTTAIALNYVDPNLTIPSPPKTYSLPIQTNTNSVMEPMLRLHRTRL